jgi:hypothetical protein
VIIGYTREVNNEQKELYEEWKRLEIATTIPTKIGSKNGQYETVAIKPNDLLKLEPIREKVWKELKEFLNLEERTNLGMSLNKNLDDIFKSIKT